MLINMDSSSATAQGRSRQRAFTLIELLVTITVLGIFAAVAVPNFTQFINNNRTQAFNNEMLSLLQYARSTAVEQRQLIKVCQEDTGWTVRKKTCSEDPLRTLDLPANVNISADKSDITYRYNGTASTTTLYTCRDNEFANGFTIMVRSSGSVRSWARGKTGPEATDAMTTCASEQQETESDD